MKIEKSVVTINDIARLSVGVNTSRISGSYPPSSFYNTSDQAQDIANSTLKKDSSLHDEKTSYALREGDIVVNLASLRCSIVSSLNAGKIMKNTFVKLELTVPFIDPWFLCYSINVSTHFKKSISPDGSVIRAYSATMLGRAEIYLPAFNKQQAVGTIYRDLCRIDFLKNTRSELIFKALNKISINR